MSRQLSYLAAGGLAAAGAYFALGAGSVASSAAPAEASFDHIKRTVSANAINACEAVNKAGLHTPFCPENGSKHSKQHV